MSDWPNGGKLSALSIRRACDAVAPPAPAPTTSTSTRCTTSTGTHRGKRSGRRCRVLVRTGQGPLRRLAPTSPAGTSPRPTTPPPPRRFIGLVSEQIHLQPGNQRQSSSRSYRQRRALRRRDHPVEPAGRRACSAGYSPSAGRRRQAGRSKEGLEQRRDAIEAYEKLCGSLGEQPANVALAWLLHQDGITGPIIGPRTAEQLEDSQRAVDIVLDEATLGQLDAIFPGYKTAPEHYAW